MIARGPTALEAHALELGTALGLRAADALYAALSVRLDADLVTTDGELLDRTADHVRVLTPARWLEAHAERSSVAMRPSSRREEDRRRKGGAAVWRRFRGPSVG